MLTLPPTLRIFVSLSPADLRRRLDGLAALTREVLNEDPLPGHLFVFFSRCRSRTRILLWDRSGLCPYNRRLEKGVFRLIAFDSEALDARLAKQGAELTAPLRDSRKPGNAAMIYLIAGKPDFKLAAPTRVARTNQRGGSLHPAAAI